jgi:hypothetical protein
MQTDLLDEAKGQHYRGVVESVATSAAQGADGTAMLPVWISAIDPLPHSLSAGTVRVTIVRASSAAPALTVPISAIFTGPSGATYVQVQKGTDQPLSVEVSLGLVADGYAQVTPARPDELTVTDLVVVGTR